MLKRILIGISGIAGLDERLGAVLELAARHGAELFAMSIVELERLADLGAVAPAGEDGDRLATARRIRANGEHAERAMRALERQGPEHGVRVTRLGAGDDPVTELARASRYHDLLVLSRRGWFDDGVLEEPESALLTLLASGAGPILGLGDTRPPAGPVMIAYNGSVESARAMRDYAQLRLWGEMPVALVCAAEDARREDGARLLGDAAAYLRAHGVVTSTACLPEATSSALLTHAGAIGASLIVMGGSYRRVLLSQRCGPHTLEVFKNAAPPVLLAH